MPSTPRLFRPPSAAPPTQRSHRESPAIGRLQHFARGLGLLLLLLLTAVPAKAIQPMTFSGSGAVSTTASLRDSAGHIYVAGYFSGSSVNVGGTTLSTIGIQDTFVAKLDAGGHAIWAKNFGGSGVRSNTVPYALAVDGDGNVYLGGSANGGDLTTPALANIGATDVYALKLDPGGNLLWAKRYGGSGTYATASSLGLDAANNVYFTGYFAYGDMTTPVLTRTGTRDIYLFKLDSDGNPQWSKRFGGSGETGALSLAVDGTGNSYMAGYFSQSLTTPPLTVIGNNDAFAMKVDSNGDVSWIKNFGGTGATAMAYGIAIDGSGNSYVAGLFQSATLTTPAMTRIGSRDAFLIKLDSDGTTGWAKHFGGGSVIADGRGVAVDNSGKVYFTGHFSNGNLTTPAMNGIGYQDGFALKLTGDGDILWQQQYGGRQAYVTNNSAMTDNSGNIFFAGKYSGAALTTPAMSANSSDNGMLIRQVAAYVPGAPTAVTVSSGINRVTVSFTPPADSGATPISRYTVTASPLAGLDAQAGSSATSHTFSGLSYGVNYTFTVTATNSEGTGDASLPSAAAAPIPPPPDPPPEPTETTIPSGGSATLGKLPVVSWGGTLTIPANSQGGSLTLAGQGTSAPTTLLIGDQRITLQPVNGPAKLTLESSAGQDKMGLILRLSSGVLNFTVVGSQPFLAFGTGWLSAGSEGLEGVLNNGRLAVKAGSATLQRPTAPAANAFSAVSTLDIYAGEVAESDGAGLIKLRIGSLDGDGKQAGDTLPASDTYWPTSVQLSGPLGRLAGQSPLDLVATSFGQGKLAQASDGSLRPALHLLPLSLRLDSSRSDGLSYTAGLTEIVRNGVVVQLAPLVVNIPAFTKELDRLAGRHGDGSFLYVQANGAANVVSSPRQFVLRSSLAMPSNGSADGFSSDSQGNWRWVSQGLTQTIYPTFRYAEQLAAILIASDPKASLVDNNDGTYQATVDGYHYRLRPDLELLNFFSIPPAHFHDVWWQDRGKLFINFANMTAQGFVVD